MKQLLLLLTLLFPLCMSAQDEIRCFIKPSTNSFYLLISEKEETDGIVLLIDKDNIEDLIRAMKFQHTNYKYDIKYAPDYLKNEYTTEGFTIGYSLEKNKYPVVR